MEAERERIWLNGTENRDGYGKKSKNQCCDANDIAEVAEASMTLILGVVSKAHDVIQLRLTGSHIKISLPLCLYKGRVQVNLQGTAPCLKRHPL